MVLDGALADTEIGRDILAGMACQHQVHDLPLTRREPGELAPGFGAPLQSEIGIPRLRERALDPERSSAVPTGFSMKSIAPAFIACTAIGTSLTPVIMMAGSGSFVSFRCLRSANPSMPGR